MRTSLDYEDQELTVEELFADYPALNRIHGWTNETPGQMCRKGGLSGYYSPSDKGYRIRRWSVIGFITHANTIQARKIIDLSSGT